MCKETNVSFGGKGMINLNVQMQVIGLVLALMIIIMNSTRKKIGLMADFSFELLSVSVAVASFLIYGPYIPSTRSMTEGYPKI